MISISKVYERDRFYISIKKTFQMRKLLSKIRKYIWQKLHVESKSMKLKF